MWKSQKKMTFEEYLQFYQFSWQSNSLRRSTLNQIVEMHGFVKLHHDSKNVIQECLDSINLMEPIRSTLEESISSCAFVKAEAIAADLEDLGWQECLLVRSVQTLKSKAEEEYIIANEDMPFVAGCTARPADDVRRRRRGGRSRRCRVPPADFVILGKRPRSKRKHCSVNALIFTAGSSASSSPLIVVEDNENFVPPLPLSPRPVTPPPPSSPLPP